MREYVRRQTESLLHRFTTQVENTSGGLSEDFVHDLRVAIRRLNRCLHVFSCFYPNAARKRMRARLKDLMKAAGRVRDLDIAARLLERAGMKPGDGVFGRLAAKRKDAVRGLSGELRHWKQRGASRKWRKELGIQ